MKKIISLTVYLYITSIFCFAQCAFVPADNTTNGKICPSGSSPDIAFDNNEVAHIVLKDTKLYVKKNNGTGWSNLGNGPVTNNTSVSQPVIKFDKLGVPYVAFRSTGNKAEVWKFNGSTWSLLGSAGFSAGQVAYLSLAIDQNNTPYVVFLDGANSNKATAMKFDGSNWVIVGNAGFSNAGTSFSRIAIDKNNVPYVIFKDGSCNPNGPTVVKFDGNSWVTVGSSCISGTSSGDTPDIAIDTNNIPYIVYQKDWTLQRAVCQKFNGSIWEDVGLNGISTNKITYTKIGFNGNNDPFITYSDKTDLDSKATVKKFDGVNWVTIGNEGFSLTRSASLNLGVSKGGTLYIGYSYSVNTDTLAGGYAYKYNCVTNIDKLQFSDKIVYPNPTNDFFTIDISILSEIVITNTLGQIIYNEKLNAGKHNLNVQNQANGIYFVKVVNKQSQQTIKLVKQD